MRGQIAATFGVAVGTGLGALLNRSGIVLPPPPGTTAGMALKVIHEPALMAGAAAQGLPESQYGLASIKFRWNVSGTYMQVVPKFISTAADGKSDVREFMNCV